MIRSAQELLSFFISLFPLFSGYWNSDDNYFLNDNGSFSISGVCAQFSHYFYEGNNIYNASDESLTKLFDFIEAELNIKNSVLDDSLCTCFLENIACTEVGTYVKEYMGEKTRTYFMQWHRE